MNETKNVQAVKAALAAFERGDIKTVLGALTDDAEIQSPGEGAGIPWAGRFRGLAGAERYFDVTGQAVEYESFEATDFLASGDKVVALVRERWVAKETGRRCDHEYAILFVLREGKIAKSRSYEDTALEAAALR